VIDQHFLQITPLARDRLIETITDSMIVLNPELQILYLNPAARILFHKTEKRINQFPAAVAGPAKSFSANAAGRTGRKNRYFRTGIHF